MDENDLINIDLAIIEEFDKIPDKKNHSSLYIRAEIKDDITQGHLSFVGEHNDNVRMLLMASKDERILKCCIYDTCINLLLEDKSKDAELAINRLKQLIKEKTDG